MFYRKYGKRIFDVLSSIALLICISPLVLLLACKVRRHLGRPVLFTQIRPGKDGKLFRLYKFRTMTDKRDEDGNLLPDNQRMTDFGRKLRATSLDELPELINIIKGDMSVVGPRPQLVRDMVFFTDEEMKRQSVLPGLTGLAQISGRNNISWDDKFTYDLQYIRKIGYKSDFKIIFRTIAKVIHKDDISTEGMATAEDLGDYLLRIGRISKNQYDAGQSKARRLIQKFVSEEKR